MKTFFKTFFNMLKKPSMLLTILILGIVFGYCEYKVPVKEIFLNFFAGENLTNLDIMDSIVYLIRILLGGILSIDTILDLLKYILIVSILFSPLYCIIFVRFNYNVLRKKELSVFKSIKKYALKIFIKTFIILTSIVVIAILLIVATIPAFIYTRAILNGLNEYILKALFIDILTVFVLFFGIYFTKNYLSFWLTATVNDDPQPFSIGKKVANISFWRLSFNFFILDILYIIIIYFLFHLPTSTVTYFIRGIGNAFCFTFFMIYILVYYADTVKKILNSKH